MKSSKFILGDRVRWIYPPNYLGTVVGPEIKRTLKEYGVEVYISWDKWDCTPSYEYTEYLSLFQNGLDKLDEIL